MDQVQLKITDIQPCEGSKIKEYDVKVIFNGVPLKHTIFNAGAVVPASRYDFAEFDLFTCTCGAAGCAGFHTEVIQNKTDATVKWTFPKDEYAVDKLEYEFDRVQFEQEFEQLRSTMLKLEKKKTYNVTCIRDNRSYVGDTSEGEARYEIKDVLLEIFDWYENRYESRQNFNSMLKEKFPGIYQAKFQLKYDEKSTQFDSDLTYLICRFMNQWPERKKEKAYLKNAESTGRIIEEALSTQDYQGVIEIIHSVWKEFCDEPEKATYKQSVWQALDYELNDLVEEKDFDVSKLSISVI